MKKYFLLLLLPLVLTISGCSDQGPVKRSWGEMKGLEKIVGNMNDTSYSSGRTQKPRPNALSEPVSMTDFEGRFVWSEYAATWCKICARQTPETKKIEKEMQGQVVFLTIMTGKSTQYNDHATVATASSGPADLILLPNACSRQSSGSRRSRSTASTHHRDIHYLFTSATYRRTRSGK